MKENKADVSPPQGVFESKDIQIDKKMLKVIRQRTQAAFQQTIKGKQKKNAKPNTNTKTKPQKQKVNQQKQMKASKSMNHLAKTKINKINCSLVLDEDKNENSNEKLIDSIIAHKKIPRNSLKGCDLHIESPLLKLNETNQNEACKKSENNLIYDSKQINLPSHDNLREYDMITDYKSTTLNISPEEFTITELNNPEVEETLMKNSSGAFNSLTQHTSATIRNIPASVKNGNSNNEMCESNLRRQLSRYYNKSSSKINSFENAYCQNHLQLFKDEKIIIQDNYYNKENEQDDAKIIETEEAEANDLIIHRSPCK